MEEEVITMVCWERFAPLLQGPGSCGVRCDIAMQDSTRRVFHEHKNIEETKGRRDHHTEVTGHDCLGMIAHKGPPSLRRRTFPSTRVQALRQIRPDSAW